MKDQTTGIRYPWDTAPELGSAIEVAEGILWMRLPLPMKLDHVNIYALDDGESWTVIDTGFASRKSREIWRSLLDGPLGGKPVTRVVVTHHHPDHVGLAGWFQSEHDAELVTTRTAWLMARMLVLDVHETPVAENLEFWRGAGMRADRLEQRASERPFNFCDVVAPMPLGYTRVKEGDKFLAAGREWVVRMGNGHAPEHATFWSSDVVLGGDQLLPSISPNLGVYATEPGADPVGALINRRDTHISVILGGTGFLDKSHASMNLNPGLGHTAANFGAVCFGDRRQKRGARAPICLAGGMSHVDGHRIRQRNGPGCKHLCLHC